MISETVTGEELMIGDIALSDEFSPFTMVVRGRDRK